MAIATNTNYYSNSIIGIPQAGADIDIHERNTTPRFAVGFGFERSDGNKYRYVQYSTAVAAGTLVGNPVTGTNKISTDAIVVATTTADAVANEIIKPGAAGSRYVEITLASVAANQYAGGTFVAAKDTGVGYSYRVKGNTATGTPKTTTFRMELWEKLKVGLDNTTDIAIASCKYANMTYQTMVLGTSNNVVGVCMSSVTADNYGWVCTRGIVGALASTANTGFGAVVMPALQSGTYVEADTVGNLSFQRIGTVVVAAGGVNQLGIVNLQLE
jgi:hypothetical protein